MVHRFLNAAKANWRFFSTLKSPVRETSLELDRQLEELTSAINAAANMTPEEMQKKLVDMFGLTNDDMKALAPLPDENDPGELEYEPHPDDDVRTHVQVGNSQCLLTNYLKRRLECIPGFPRPVKEMGDKAYRISPTLHRGLGMFAARRFRTGDLVADERPLMVFPVGPPTDFNLATAKVPGENRIKLNLKSSDDILSSLFERMSEESQEAFMGLQNSHLGDGAVFGTARTNGYGLDNGLKDETENVKFFSTLSSDDKMMQLVKSRVGTYAGVFKDLSRVNHSCSPNIRRKFHMSTFSMQLRAARDIEEGEEIFTTYTQDLRPAADRAKGLAPYGIKCTCRACLDPARSDPIRAAVLNYSPPTLVTSAASARDAAVQTLVRIEVEGLQASDAYLETLYDLFNAYAYAQDEKNALMYGEKLWLANLAAGEPLYEMFRNAELMKKSPPWMAGKFEETPERLVSLFNAS